MPNVVKVPAEKWIKTARKALITEGRGGVKIDRLARTLGVTRGGFYHNFKSHAELMGRLLDDWASSNEFVPAHARIDTPADAFAVLEEMVDRLILEKDFSPAFEKAIREWARTEPKVERFVSHVDGERIARLEALFAALGCDAAEASLRAQFFFYHQMGAFALGRHGRQAKADRLRAAPAFLKLLCGPYYPATEERSAS